MARISTYTNDNIINDQDRLIGTDGGQIGTGGTIIAGTAGGTKNFTVGALRQYINSGAGSGGSGTGVLNTNLITSSPTEAVELFTAHTVYSPGNLVNIILPTAATTATPILQDGSWLRISKVANTGLRIFAGAMLLASAAPGDRFMAGVDSNGIATVDPHLLQISTTGDASFELIYIADNITIGGTTAPVGWIIIN